MSIRLEELSQVLFELFNPAFEPVYVAVTTLGDTAVLVALLAITYWALDRRPSTLRTMSIVFLGLAVVVTLKGFFAASRPDVALIEIHGYGFPSGHALGATVVYGALAIERNWLSDRRKLAGVVTLVGAIGLSRVALRVHYLGDVLIGFAIGLVVLAAANRYMPDDPRPGFAIGGLLGIVAVLLTSGGANSIAVVAASIAGLIATSLYATTLSLPALSSQREGLALTAVGLPLVAAAKVGPRFLPLFPGVAGVDEFLMVMVIFLLPFAYERLGVSKDFGRGSETR